MPHTLRIAFLPLALALLACFLPQSARAAHLGDDDAAMDFADSKPVSDKDLSHMRGGMFDVNGVLISFGYSASTAINGVTQSSVSFTDADLAAHNPNLPNLANGLPPTVVQNVDNNTLIQVQQQLDVTVSGATQAIANRIPFAELGRMLH